ncbi:MAG: DUF4956 domain-containing protein [Verrucomicrobiota bacterium]|nr:DUF4956 domain-containing protein [Verrucomicrobiota bacterium]
MQEFLELFRGFVGVESEAPQWLEIMAAILQSFLLSAIISAVYKRTYRGQAFSQDYVHTLIILGMGVAVVMMVVKGNPATAFGMFAAFSIIRFRRTVSQARDIGFVFLSMAAGMAIGARQYVLAWATITFICAIIYLFSEADLFAPARVSHFLRLRITNDIDYDTAFRDCFAQHLLRWELKSVESIQAGMMTELRLDVTLKEPRKPGAFVAQLQQLNGNNRVLLTSAASDPVISE